MQDAIGAVGEHDVDDVQPFPRLRPQGLQAVHAGAVRLEADHLAVGCRDGGTGGAGKAVPDSPACDLQPVVWRSAKSRREQRPPRGHAILGDDGVVRQQQRQGRREGLGAEPPFGERRGEGRVRQQRFLGRAQLVGERLEGGDHVLLRAGQDVHVGPRWREQARSARVGEEGGRGFRASQDEMPDIGEHFQRAVHRVGNPIHRGAAATARHARHLGRAAQAGTGRLRDPVRRAQAGFRQCRPGQQQHGRLAAPQGERRHAKGLGIHGRAWRDRQGIDRLSAFAPGRICRQDQGGDLSRRRHGCLDRRRGIGAHPPGRAGGTHPV